MSHGVNLMPSSWIAILIAPKAEADLSLLFPKKKVDDMHDAVNIPIHKSSCQRSAQSNYYLRRQVLLLNQYDNESTK